MILTTLIPLLLSASDPQPVTEAQFTFAPPHGLRVVQQLKETTRDKIGPKSPVVEKRESTSDIEWTVTDDGYLMTITLRRIKFWRDGKRYIDPRRSVLVNKPITYHLSKTGELQAIEGYDQLREGFGRIPMQLQQTVARDLQAERMGQRDTAEWNRRYSKFIGRSIKVGDKWENKDISDPAFAGLRVHALTRFPGIVRQDERTLVTVDYQYASVDEIADGRSVESTGTIPVLKAKGQMVVDASTMMFVSERFTSTAAGPYSEYQDGTPVNRLFSTELEYSYEAAPPAAPEAPVDATPQPAQPGS